MYNITSIQRKFNPDCEVGSSVSKRWETWLKDFKTYCVAIDITGNARKRALLLYEGGQRVRQIFSNLTGEDNDFDTAMTKLTEYFTPLKNTRYEIYKFRQLKQEDSESLDTFHMRLRESSCNCQFTNVDSEIEQQIITGGKFTQIRKSALKNPNYTLKDMLVDGRGKEFSSYQAKDIESKLKEESIDRFIQIPSTEIKRKCFYCGGEFPHKAICLAKGKQCNLCRRYNHFASCCRRVPQKQAQKIDGQKLG